MCTTFCESSKSHDIGSRTKSNLPNLPLAIAYYIWARACFRADRENKRKLGQSCELNSTFHLRSAHPILVSGLGQFQNLIDAPRVLSQIESRGVKANIDTQTWHKRRIVGASDRMLIKKFRPHRSNLWPVEPWKQFSALSLEPRLVISFT